MINVPVIKSKFIQETSKKMTKEMNFKLRNWCEKDVVQLSEIANDTQIAKKVAGFFPSPYTQNDAKQWVKHCLSLSKQKAIEKAIIVDNKVAGGVGIYFQDDKKTAEIGYWLGKKYWNKGIMSKVVKKIVGKLLKSDEVNNINAVILDTNLASKKVLEKNGFIYKAPSANVVSANSHPQTTSLYTIQK